MRFSERVEQLVHSPIGAAHALVVLRTNDRLLLDLSQAAPSFPPANAVIEGCDSNGCEYMTGGNIVILGNVGDNFAAGMTGGMAFVYDKDLEFEKRVNPESVVWARPQTEYWKNLLYDLLVKHHENTNSNHSKKILENFGKEINTFFQVCPKEMLNKLKYPISEKIINYAS